MRKASARTRILHYLGHLGLDAISVHHMNCSLGSYPNEY
jgi:hypothetical protein